MKVVGGAVLAFLVVIALAYNGMRNDRSDWEQSWYDRGYAEASLLIDEGADSEDEVVQGCDVMAPTDSNAVLHYNTGCDDRWAEE
jgi:hypothetical protein